MAGVSLFSRLVTSADALAVGFTPLNIARTTSGMMFTNLFVTTIVRAVQADWKQVIQPKQIKKPEETDETEETDDLDEIDDDDQAQKDENAEKAKETSSAYNAKVIVYLCTQKREEGLMLSLLGLVTAGCLASRVHPVLGAAMGMAVVSSLKFASVREEDQARAPLAVLTLLSTLTTTGFASLELMRWTSGKGAMVQLLAGIGATTLFIGILPTIAVECRVVSIRS